MYIRFAVTQIDEESTFPKGIFIAADDLRDSMNLSASQEKHLREMISWFNEHLPAPDDFYHTHAIFWFRVEAKECIRRVWKLIGFLREHGYLITHVTCERPGKVVYSDEYQVAAIPFKDTRRRL